ncbi:MAG: hypothetical protein ACRBBW_16175 [Cellvibrionaceae bacterium]
MSEQEVSLFGTKSEMMPAHLTENTADQGLGNEDVGVEDMALPRLNLLQPLSPQLDEVDGAKAGLLHNSITDELYESVYLINLKYSKEFSVFKKRDFGGGFNGSYESKAQAQSHIETLPGSPSQYDIVETAKHICLMLDSEGKPKQPVALFMKSTGLSVSRKWNSDINVRNEGAARFATVWELSSIKKSNDKGSWFIFVAEFAGWASEGLYEDAKGFYAAQEAA